MIEYTASLSFDLCRMIPYSLAVCVIVFKCGILLMDLFISTKNCSFLLINVDARGQMFQLIGPPKCKNINPAAVQPLYYSN